jgi:hypothetical protein
MGWGVTRLFDGTGFDLSNWGGVRQTLCIQLFP